jgi:ribosomal protein S27AE
MVSWKKVNLEKVQASLDAVCPKCGKAISPAEVRRIDFERMECPACGERFAPIKPTAQEAATEQADT